MGNGGSKPESTEPVHPGLLPIRRRIEEIRRRRKLRHRDSILSTTELLKEAEEVESVAEKEASDSGAADGQQLLTVPESESETEAAPEAESERNTESTGEERELGFANLPQSPSFRHFAAIDLPVDSDDSGKEDDGHEDHPGRTTDGEAAAAAGAKKKKKGRRLRSFARGPVVVCGLLHVQSCYSAPRGSPKSTAPPPPRESDSPSKQSSSSAAAAAAPHGSAKQIKKDD